MNMTCSSKGLKGSKRKQLLPEAIQLHIGNTLPEQFHEDWQGLAKGQSVFLDLDYLFALTSGCDGVDIHLAWFTCHDRVVGIAAFQQTEARAQADEATSSGTSMIGKIARCLLVRKDMRMQMLVLGSSFSTGAHGFAFVDEIDAETRSRLLTQAAENLRKQLKESGQQIDATLVKDFLSDEAGAPEQYKSCGYTKVVAAPNLLLPVLPDWQHFDDYLQALTSKYRTKAKAALRRSSELEIRRLGLGEIEDREEQIHALYLNVKTQAGLAIGELSKNSFAAMARHLGDRFVLFGYFLEGEMIGFQCAIHNGNCLDAHLVGFDYDLNPKYALYPRMLYTFIDCAIQGGFSHVNFGRTATEIKSTVGAQLVEMHGYLRYRKAIPNTLLQLFASWVNPPQEPSHQAYKQETLKVLQELAVLEHENS